jgi:hypothetical protein
VCHEEGSAIGAILVSCLNSPDQCGDVDIHDNATWIERGATDGLASDLAVFKLWHQLLPLARPSQ